MNNNDQKNSSFPIDCLNRLVEKNRELKNQNPNWQSYFLPVEELSEGLPIPLLGIMVLIWQLRPMDLQIIYPLDTIESRLEFIGWCVANGSREYVTLRENREWWDKLRSKATIEDSSMDRPDAGNIYTWEMVFVERMRKDLKFDIKTIGGRNDFFVWFTNHGSKEINLVEWTPSNWQKKYLEKNSGYHSLTNYELIVYQSRQDVMDAFPLPEEYDNFIKWLSPAIEFPPPQSIHAQEIFSEIDKDPFGVNVIGYAFGQLGIGEDARMATAALDCASVPVLMLNFAPGKNVGQNELSMQKFVKPDGKYNINMYCLTAIEHGRYFAENGSEAIVKGYNIGYWPWELNEWPDEWSHLFALVNEVWVSSRHTYDSIAPISSVPVILMPMAVEIPQPSGKTRSDFGLPQDGCLFLFSFDINSSIYRKNPSACIDAFLLAFPHSEFTNEVGLVIKVQAGHKNNDVYPVLKSLHEKDSRIFLIEETLSKPDLLALYKCCDAFVSLHRAEGFGRNIAEAMLLERPVIVTGYSGNLSFNSSENSLLVKSRLIPVQPGEYENSSGMVWAEPDIIHASKRMKQILHCKDAVKIISKAGKSVIEFQHNPLTVGKRYRERLELIKPT
ncbi:glycosyltransferase involved in cell wall biosynthesis [Massilia sp. MP_M2]|uniref:glycosyltransferase n=1 Tax=Massilia sp. MP_M2 TaxID=3071713 RepID=UPI00319E2641